MPTYEFRCRSCGATFTEQRPMASSSDPARCPVGHDDTVRLLSVAGAILGGRGSHAPVMQQPPQQAGGCCGGGCCG